MRIDGVAQAPIVNPGADQKNIQVIDEDQIRTILFLGIRGNIKIQPDDGHSVDKYA